METSSTEHSRQRGRAMKRSRDDGQCSSDTAASHEKSTVMMPDVVDVDGLPTNELMPLLRSEIFCTSSVERAVMTTDDTKEGSPARTRVSRHSNGYSSGTEEGGATGSSVADHRRLKQSTLAVYGMVSDTAVFRKELSDRDAQIQELKDRMKEMEEEARRRDAHVELADTHARSLDSKLGHFQSVMRTEMLRTALQCRTEARRLLHQKHFELGQITTWPGNGREAWVEGNEMKDLIHRLAEVTKRRDEVETLKRAAQNTLRQLSKQEREESAGPEFMEALMEAQEEWQLRASEHTELTNIISNISQHQTRLENEKKAFVKEIRRLNDEDASEFIGVPTIGEGQRYVLMHLLGKGGFSEVWKAFDVFDGQYVACKIHRINRDWSAQTRAHYLRHAERELEIMRLFNHPHLTTLYNVFQLNDTMFVSVMEYSKGMDLDTYLKRYRTLKEADARLILLQMVNALRYLANLEEPIIHYDLKPANILLHSDDPSILEIKITDFGLSKIICPAGREGPSDNPSIELTSQGTGTYWYLPPECFETSATPRISNKVDIWSVGVIFYQMLYGRRPFAEGESQRKIWQEKLILSSARTLNFPVTPRVSDEAKELISLCLAFNAHDRCDIMQLSQHPYLFRTSRRSGKPKGTTSAAPA